MMISTPCVFRADASPRMGIGHVMRCLALAHAWQAGGGRSVFLTSRKAESLCQRIAAEGVDLTVLADSHPDPQDLEGVLQAWRASSRDSVGPQTTASGAVPAGWCVLDGYHFDPTYQGAIRAAGCRVLVIDDTAHWPEYSADILLNQNVTADQLTYRCNPDAALLLGTRYVLLRPEFLAWGGWKREVPESAHRVLVTMGGSDEGNVSLQVIRMLQDAGLPDMEVKVLIGPANARLPVLRQSVESLGLKCELLTEVTDMPGTMAWADVAISGAGSTCWELAFMGVPSIVLTLADNQAAIAAELHRLGAAVHLGEASQIDRRQFVGHLVHLLASRRAREAMVSRGQGLVDGWGPERVVMRMRGEKLWLRTACAEDARLIWEWANEPGARSVSFSPEPIPWEQHVRWFTEKLNDGDCEYYVALNEDETPVGQIRFDVKEKRATVSLSLDSRFRGMGYGSAMIALAARKVFRSREVELIHAYVKMDNAASLRAFSKASFRQDELIQIRGQAAARFVLPKDTSR